MLSKCCNAKAIKQEAGNHFCSHCISICETKRSFSKLLLLPLLLLSSYGFTPNYAMSYKMDYSEQTSEKTILDYYKVNPMIIEVIESNGNSFAISIKDAKGIMQVTNICLLDYNKANKTNYTESQLFIPEINKEVANWYISIRIPELLKERHLKVNVANVLICYNGGIQEAIRYNTRGELNEETKNYLIKYFHSI